MSGGVIRGVVFDLDGVIADTERLQWQAYRTVLLGYGVDVGLEAYRRHFIAVGAGPEWVCATHRLAVTPDALREEKAVVYGRLLRDGIVACPGARAALARLRATHRIALATNTVRDEVDFILGRLGVAALFHATVAREDYTRPKPEPDAYLAAAAALGLGAGECAVVEDTERGLRAGLAAGARVVVVPNDLTFDNDFTGAARRLAHLDELTADLLATLADV
ncbi:MAG TPA: HAD family phosphatase [Candidatus Binatia bacterium]|nr:HAD family phosphatase [Candidatus Binatia bacterium]